jgi:hypothetical protein
MSMPFEYTRALRWGWEFLLELRDSACITDAQRNEIEALLLVVPCARDLMEWTAPGGTNPLVRKIELDVEDKGVSRSDVVEWIDRPPVSVDAYFEGIVRAALFFKSLRGLESLGEKYTRQIPYVLRHWPLHMQWEWG